MEGVEVYFKVLDRHVVELSYETFVADHKPEW